MSREEIRCKNCRADGWTERLAKINGWKRQDNLWVCAACDKWPNRDITVDDPHERLS